MGKSAAYRIAAGIAARIVAVTTALEPCCRYSLLLRSSIGLHAGALVVLVMRPATWPWLLALLLLNHVLLTAAGLWPRARLLGPNITRLPAASAARGEVALTIDDGPDPAVTPAVLDLLRRHGARATFFVIGERALREPALVQRMLAEGHSVQNHSFAHRHHFSLQGPRGLHRELARAQQALQGLSGTAPRFFRAPAGLRNPFLQPVLCRHGLHLTSWTRRGFDTRESDPQRVLQRLLHGLRGGDILLLHDGHAARTADGQPVVLQVLPPLLAQLQAAGLRCVTLPEAFMPTPAPAQGATTTPAAAVAALPPTAGPAAWPTR